MLQLLVLSLEPLTVAQPLQVSGVVVTILFSRLLLHERLGRAELACIGVIAVAAALLSLSSGHGPGTEAGTRAAGAAIAAAAVPACVAVPVIYCQARRGDRLTGVREGCCAGLIYGFAGLALKALSAAVFAAPHSRGALLAAAVTSPYLYVMLVSSAIGMCLFQVALQRSPASVVMPISLVISTGYLVVIGSWLFHERLPASPVPLAMRLGGGVAAVIVPVILTVVSERAATRRVADVSDDAASRARAPCPIPERRSGAPCPARSTGPGAANPMSLDPLLLDLLACPIDKQPLLYLAEYDVLYNPRLRRSYQIRDGIPVMLADQWRDGDR